MAAAAAATMPPDANATKAHTLEYTPTELPRLRANYGPYIDRRWTGHLQPTPATAPLSVLRSRFSTDGYIWVKDLIPREDVLDMRERYFAHMAPTGLLRPGTSPREGIFDGTQDPIAHSGVGGSDLPEDLAKVEKLTEAHALECYHEFLAHPALRRFVREFTGWEKETLIMRNMLRHNVPGGLSTGIHYDQIFLRAGESEFLTAWIPIGDCKASGGGLMYLEGSAALGKEMEADFMRRAEHFTEAERISGFNANMARDGQLSHDATDFVSDRETGNERTDDTQGRRGHRRWLTGDFEAGDVVFHNPYVIHGSLKNEDPEGRIRLSSDVRFYEYGASKDERWMELWRPDDGL